jgi:L-ascorbate metabolism protein UlaG (beta-lactamase superfamily)
VQQCGILKKRITDAIMPGYTPEAARSSARRYPKHLARTFAGGREDVLVLPPPVLDELAQARLGAVWLGHATVLLRMGGMWVLTDPVFSSKVGVKVGPVTFGVPRHTPAVDPRAIPRPDLVLLSHAHFDHLDKPSLRALVDRRTRVLTAEHTKMLVPRGFGSVQEVRWGEGVQIGDVVVRAIRPNHWGARAIWDKHRGFNSYLMERAGASQRVLFAGDTAATDAFAGVGPVELSIFGIGAYDPWVHAHANPEQVWEMHGQAGGEYLLPMHHSTFELSDEPSHEPLERLLRAAGERAAFVVGRGLGEAWTRS